MDKRYLSRKFQLSVAAAVAGCGFFAAGMLSADQWVSFTQWVVGLYMAGNVGDTFAERSAAP